jgi:serine/threonine protein kinase
MARSREMLPQGTILQNRYRVMRELGHGGMGTVYEALDQRINCLVALKETSAGNENEARRAFEREASLLGNLRHSGLPKVMDYFSEGEADFLIMEFIPGDDLAHLLEERGSPFPQDEVLTWADELLKVLEYLHGQEPPILHRDIKPANLKLTLRGEIFLLDFGLAKGTAGQMPTLATSRSVYGYTPVYASLEQILGQGTDPRSDIYSVGATLYHLLTGVIPVDAPKRFSHSEDEKPDPLQRIETLIPNCSPRVAATIHQAMSLNRRQRQAGAAEMRRALREASEKDAAIIAEATRAVEEKRERQFAGTLRLDEAFSEEVERVRREEEARQADALRLAEVERQRLQEAQRAEAERRRAAEEARRLAEAERQRLEIERQRVAEQKEREAQRLSAPSETTVLSPPRVVGQRPVVNVLNPPAVVDSRFSIVKKLPLIIGLVVLSSVALVAAVLWWHPWGGAAVVSNVNNNAAPSNSNASPAANNSNLPAVPDENTNKSVRPHENSNRTVVPVHTQTNTRTNPLERNTNSNTRTASSNENRNRANTDTNTRKVAEVRTPPPPKNKKHVDEAAERRRRARRILDQP